MSEPSPSPPPPAPAPPPSVDVQVSLVAEQRRALGYMALVASAIILWMAMPIGVGLLFGALAGFLLEPFHRRLTPRLGHAPAALVTVLAASLVILGALFGLGWLFVDRGVYFTKQLVAETGPGGAMEHWLAQFGELTQRFDVTPAMILNKLRDSLQVVAERAALLAAALMATSATLLLEMFFGALTMHFILRYWAQASVIAEDSLPLRPDYTRSLFAEFRVVGRTTLLGTMVTGMAQGAFAVAGYLIAGVPEALFLGAVTAVASVVPAIGTALVWIPASLLLMISGQVGAGVIVLVWSLLFVIGVSDYVLRPRLVGGESKLPSLITFVALFGGVEAFGLKGLVVGPVAMSIAIAVLRLYRRELRARREAAREPAGLG